MNVEQKSSKDRAEFPPPTSPPVTGTPEHPKRLPGRILDEAKKRKPEFLLKNAKREAISDVVTLGEVEFRLERRVGGSAGEAVGKSETWQASIVGSTSEKVFLKRFISPKYPTPEEIRDTAYGRENKRDCEKFEERHNILKTRLNGNSAGSGSLVKPIAFGRQENSFSYIKIYPWVNGGEILSREIARNWSIDQRITFIRTLCLAIWELHSRGIVHGDLKSDNVLVIHLPIGPVARLIDFDEAFLVEDPPVDGDFFVGTTVLTPEWYVLEDPSRCLLNVSMKLGLHTDIFQLSLLLHGIFAEEKINWVFLDLDIHETVEDDADASLRGGRPNVSDLGVNNPRLKQQLELSLDRIPSSRPTIKSILSSLGVTV